MYLVKLMDGIRRSISCVPKMVNVVLGNDGCSIALVKTEHGTWRLGDALFQNSAGAAREPRSHDPRWRRATGDGLQRP